MHQTTLFGVHKSRNTCTTRCQRTCWTNEDITIGIFLNPCSKIRATTKDRFASQGAIEEGEIHEQIYWQYEEGIHEEEAFIWHIPIHAKDIKDLWTPLDGDQTLGPNIKELLTCLSPEILCIEDSNEQAKNKSIAWERKGCKPMPVNWRDKGIMTNLNHGSKK